MGALGDSLRERRVALGISFEQAEQATRIRARLLKALENGEYDRLPATGYVRGYVSSYARFLELDPVPLLAMLEAETGAVRSTDLKLPQLGEAVAPTGQQHTVPWRVAIAALLIISLVSLSIWAVARVWRGPEPPLPDLVVPAEGSATAEPAASAVVEPDNKPPAEALPFTLDVKVVAEGASWLLVTIDGKKAYEGTLTGGQSKHYEVARSATIKIGRPSDVVIMRDGERIEIPRGDTPTLRLQATPSP